MNGAIGRDNFADLSAAEALAAGVLSATAGSSPDGVEQNGLIIDREALGALGIESVAFVIAGRTTLAATKTLSISANWQEASDSGFSADVGDVDTTQAEVLSAVVVATGAATAAKVYAKLPLNLQLCTQRYVRCQFTADLSNTGTDTFVLSPVYVMGNPNESPSDQGGLSPVS